MKLSRCLAFGLTALLTAPPILGQDLESSLVKARHLEHAAQDPAKAIPAYQGVVDEADHGTRAQGIALEGLVRCLLKIGDHEQVKRVMAQATKIATPALVQRLNTLESSYRSEPVQGDDSNFESRVAQLVRNLKADDNQTKTILHNLGEVAVPYIIEGIETTTSTTLIANGLLVLAWNAGESSQSPAVDYFASLSESQDMILISQALEALARIALPQRLAPTLKSLMRIEVPGVQSRLVRLLPALEDEETRAYIRKLAESSSQSVRYAAYTTSASMSEEFARELATRLFQNERPENEHIRSSVLKACFDRRSTPLITTCLIAKASDVRLPSWNQLDFSYSASDLNGMFDEAARRELVPAFLDTPTEKGRTLKIGLELLPLTPEQVIQVARRTDRTMHVVVGLLTESFRLEHEHTLINLVNDDVAAAAFLNKCEDVPSPSRNRVLEAILQHHSWKSKEGEYALRLILQNPDMTSARVAREITKNSKTAWEAFESSQIRNRVGGAPLNLFEATFFTFDDSRTPEVEALLVYAISQNKPAMAEAILNSLPNGKALARSKNLVGLLTQIATNHPRAVKTPSIIEKLLSTKDDDLLLPLFGASVNWRKIVSDEVIDVLFDEGSDILTNSRAVLAGSSPSSHGKLAKKTIERLSVAANDDSLRAGASSLLDEFLDDEDLASTAFRALRIIHGPEPSDDLLRKGLACPYGNVIESTLRIIASSKRQSMHDDVVAALKSPNGDVRLQAIETLIVIAQDSTGEALLETLKDSEVSIRERGLAALRTLQTYREEKERWNLYGIASNLTPLERLVKQARSDDADVRVLAVRSLGALGDPAALPDLIDLMADSDEGVRNAAKAAVDKLTSGDLSNDGE